VRVDPLSAFSAAAWLLRLRRRLRRWLGLQLRRRLFHWRWSVGRRVTAPRLGTARSCGRGVGWPAPHAHEARVEQLHLLHRLLHGLLQALAAREDLLAEFG
jgi:hypothetical protein